MATPSPARFVAGESGAWRIVSIVPVRGPALPAAERLDRRENDAASREAVPGAAWSLAGVAGHARYATTDEQEDLAERSPGLGRPHATCAALIPIRKTDTWWSLGQDTRRRIFAERARHLELGCAALPAVARRLYHARDLGEPFDFLAWFEYPPDAADAFEALVSRLRDTEEWAYVRREVDIRLLRHS